MLEHIRVITGGGRVIWGYLALTAGSAILQATAVLTLFPLLGELFSAHPITAGPWVALLLVIIAAAWGVDVAAAHLGLRLGIKVMRAIHRHTPDAILSWSPSTFTPAMSGELRTLVANRAVEATSGVILMVSPIITAVVFTIALGAGLLMVSAPVAAVTVAGGVLVLLALWAGSRMESKAQEQYSRATEELDNRLFEFAWAQPALRTARNVSVGERLVGDAIATTRGRVLRLLLWQIPGESLFSLVLQLVLLGYGAATWLAFESGALSLAAAATLIIVLLRVVEQITVVSGTSGGVVLISRTLTRVREIMATTPVAVADPLPHAPRVVARGLRVTHPDGSIGLRDVNLDLRPGTVTVVVGRSGSGKTTLLRALAGLVPVTDGTIILSDGVDGAEHVADEGELRGNATVVFQQATLGEGTLRDNLTAINPDLSREDLERIAETAHITSILARADAGWDTPVGEYGAQLSGGERQRVGIARALAKPSRLLLADEITSALDAQNERLVVESVNRIRRDYTTVIVTHRPALLDIADEVVVMGDGGVIEHGSPASLEAAGGEYTRLLGEWRASAGWRI